MTDIHGFKLVRREHIAEYQLEADIYTHVRTGAELLSIIAKDENKVFGITFRTPPWDSTGVAHILEHSVLCGSRKYPLKEPFVELLKGSLQTFLNAFTYPDKTCYPVASQNLQDFYNLVDIYMDAALHPLLDRHTFDQEAWHYELEDAAQQPIYKGVVFNEMKGVYASADSLLGEHSTRVLFPDITYGVDYGGDPRHIPDLTWEQLVAFHRKYYHPSNARIYYYGDDDPVERLRRMDAYLSEYERAEIDSAVPLQRADRILPARVTLPYPADQNDEDARLHLTVNWRLGEATDPVETMGLHLLDHILTETPASPLRKALIDSELGEDLTGVGLEGHLRQMMFSTGMKGIESGDEDKVVALIDATLQRLVRDGIDPKTIEASINSEEFHFRELNTGSYPRGLSLMVAALQVWNYDGDPLAGIRYQAPLDEIKRRVASGERYFEDLIRKWLLDNPHRTTLLLTPDGELKNRLDREEAEKLAAIKAGWGPERIAAVIEHTRALKQRQTTPDSPEALRCIPSLAVADLPRRNKPLPMEVAALDGTPLLVHDLFTQGIAYLDVGFNLKALPAPLLPLVPLWSRALLETGTAREDVVELTQRIGRTTGGIEPECYTSSLLHRPEAAAWVLLRGKALDERLPDLLAIIDDVLTSARLDNRERVRQLAAEEKAELESNLIPGGHRYVAMRLKARFNASDWIQEQLGGITYLQALRSLEQEIESDWSGVLARLRAIHDVLTRRGNMLVNLTADGRGRTRAESAIASFLARRPSGATPSALETPARRPDAVMEGLTIPAQVHYVGKGINLHQHGHRVTGHDLVVNRYLRTAWLWDQVRVQGGAYGAFSMLDARSGQLTFTSYRDPNNRKTLAIYDRTADYLAHLAIDRAELDRAIIGAIGDMDTYLLPDAKGYIAMGRHLSSDNEDNRQRLREEILSTETSHFRAFGDKIRILADAGEAVIMGARDQLDTLQPIRLTTVL